MPGIFDRARAGGHELRLTRADLSGEAFTALWPVLPPDHLRNVQTYADLDLPVIPPKTRSRVLPLLREIVITRHMYHLCEPTEPITLRAKDLSKFVRAALRVSGVRSARLRLVGVSVDRVTPAVERMFTEVAQEHVPRGSDCVIM
ncbi:hypothetical protein AURDEDRAFT_160641 [Auricularia subglabra TFB-10046 SS5]|nr:hypothetical protein AURDEDRAFT_160641 [Auricularia subglabra TFB-10046 SS5]